MAEIDKLRPNSSIELSVFTLKIRLKKFSFSVDFIGLRHNFSLICYFPEIISILEKICPHTLLKSLLIFNLFMTYKARKSQ